MGEVRKSLFLNVCGWREKSFFGKIIIYFYSVLKLEVEILNRIGVFRFVLRGFVGTLSCRLVGRLVCFFDFYIYLVLFG